MRKTALICDSVKNLEMVYGDGRSERLAAVTDLLPGIFQGSDIVAQAERLKDVEAVFSTWGMPLLTKEQLAALPSLKAVFYAAGSVKCFAAPLLDNGIMVVSGWAANAVPVAEFTTAQIVLANKGFFRNQREAKNQEFRRNHKCFSGHGNYGETVALLGTGQIGRGVAERLKAYNLKVIAFDPFLKSEDAARLGVEKVSLEDAFKRGYTVSNHIADVPATRGMINRRHFESMRPDATFINTGRGATIVESDLIAVLGSRPDLTAVLDVTAPEPPLENSPLFSLPNVVLTSHIAGSLADETRRMADYMVEEFLAWESGRPLRYQVTADMLERMA